MVRLFSEFVIEQVKDYLPVKYQGIECKIVEHLGNNGVNRTGIEFRKPGGDMRHTIYMDSYYEKMKEGKSKEAIMGEITEMMKSGYDMGGELKEPVLKDFQQVKPFLKVFLVNTKANRRKLFHMPYMEMEDLSMVCRVHASLPGWTEDMEVTDGYLERWGISKEALFGAALKNMWESRDYVMQEGDSKVDACLSGFPEPENLLDTPDSLVLSQREPIYVLTNKEENRGASAVLCPRVMEKVCMLLPEGFYILPSSIHEVMIVPKGEEKGPKELGKLVRDINLIAVQQEEILSDRIYEYDREVKRIRQVPESMRKREEMER